MSEAVIHSRSGFRRLDKLRLAQSTSRILNLIALERNLAEESRIADMPVATERRRGPARFFSNDVLNRAIYLKHNLRRDEERLFSTHRHVETKVFIPFDCERLEIGGQSFFIGETAFNEIVRNILRLDLDSADGKTKRDVKVLNIFKTIPSFDPFILRERLRMAGIKVDRRYFIASYNQTKDATEAVFADFRPLIESALGKEASHEELTRFVEQVWNVSESSRSNIFFETLKIPRSEWLDIVFAWKALLFYRLEGRKADSSLSRMVETIRTIKIHASPGMSELKEIRRLEHRIAKNLFRLKERAVSYVENTSEALMNAVSDQFDATAFRDTLRELSGKIVELGTDFTIFDQVVSYYLYLYQQRGTQVDGATYEVTMRGLDEILTLRFSQPAVPNLA